VQSPKVLLRHPLIVDRLDQRTLVRRVQVAPSRIPPRCVLDQQLPRAKSAAISSRPSSPSNRSGRRRRERWVIRVVALAIARDVSRGMLVRTRGGMEKRLPEEPL
jgi:hypothetical protein